MAIIFYTPESCQSVSVMMYGVMINAEREKGGNIDLPGNKAKIVHK